MEVYKNSFDGGLDTNISQRLIPPNKYIQAANVNIATDGNFYAIENIKGTEEVAIILGETSEGVLAVYASKYKIGDAINIPCLTVFAVQFDDPVYKFKILCYDTINEDIYELYEKEVTEDYLTNNRLIDCVLYPENGIDILYYTDHFFKIGKLRCEIPLPYTANFLTDIDVQMQRRGALGLVELVDIVEGGALFAGSYQFAYQMINPETNQFTKFSMFCNPIHVYLKPTDPLKKTVRSGIGLQSNYKIKFNIPLSADEAAYYTHFRVAVLENIQPNNVVVETAQLTVIEAVSDFINGTVLENIEYNANVRLESIPVSEIVVDHLALEAVKTLAVRQNRIVTGNVKYRELAYDNGEPSISGGEVVKRVSPLTKNSFADPVFASKYRGHFRDEVYRYAISYFDEDMNFSFPKVLNLTGVVFNQFGVEDTIVTPNPELLQDPSFNNGFNWVDTDWPNDDPVENPSFAIGGNAVATFDSNPLSSNYTRTAVVLDHTRVYNYILNYTNTILGYVPYISFWNDTTFLSEFPASPSGSFSPPPNTTFIGLRVFNTSGNGTFTYLDFSVKEAASSVIIPPVTVTGFDLKYPARSANIGGETFTLFGEGGKIQSLGLSLQSIVNHPTWAKGFVILRANRIKEIQFQTPIIPMNKAYATGALEEYPQLANELSGTGRRTIEYPSAQPMGPFTTYIPRNYFWNSAQDIEMFATAAGASDGGLQKKFTGDAKLALAPNYTLGMIFPPVFMYETKPFLFNPTFKATPIDAVLVKKDSAIFSTPAIGSQTPGRNIKTSASASFYGLQDERYYYDSDHGGVKASLTGEKVLAAYKEFINFSEGTTVGGYDVFRYDKLDTPGIFWGIKANVQKCAVVKLESSKIEINNTSAMPFAIGTQTGRSSTATQIFDPGSPNNCQTIEIVNITSGLEDTRYGKVDTPHEYIFTGTLVTFNSAELVDVAAGNPVPKTVEVWGGDCYVSPHLFKLTDTVYGVSNSEKFEGLTGLDLINGVKNWEKSFNDLEIGSEANVSIPVPFKNGAQYINVVLESEYNAGVFDTEIINTLTYDNDDFPVFNVNSSSEGACRVPLTYDLNINHKKQNSDKIFRIKDPLLETNNTFSSRLVYTDQKVYQTNIIGFDIFRVLNFYDLEETYGPIYALALSGDELYSLQERAVVYIGIGERLLETTDALQLSVQSGSFIGNVMYIDVDRGTQHMKSVVRTGNAVYFADVRNKTINRLSNKSLDIISEATMSSTFRALYNQSLPERSLLSMYDPVLKQLWFNTQVIQVGGGPLPPGNPGGDPTCFLYDEARGLWVSNYEFPENAFSGGAYISPVLYLVGLMDSTVKVYSMYTGPYGQLFDVPVTPSITSVVNPQMEVSKVFDALLVPAGQKLKEFDITIIRPDEIGIQELLGTTLDVTTRGESNYRTKVLRDQAGGRLRGLGANIKLIWHNNSVEEEDLNVASKVPSFLTKYRLSENKF